MARRILVTRPQPGAAETAARLSREGFAPVVLPMTEIVSLPPVYLPDPAAYRAVALTSANAVRHAPPQLLERLSGIATYAVGAATARAASAAGLTVAATGDGDGARLADLMAMKLPPQARVLFLTGRVRSPGFAERASDNGFKFDMVEVYDARALAHTVDFVAAVTGWKPFWAVLIHSGKGAEALAALAARPQIRLLFEGTRYLCISERAAQPLKGLTGKILVAASPSEDALHGLLDQSP